MTSWGWKNRKFKGTDRGSEAGRKVEPKNTV
jgi:hypothetical protein